MPTSTVGSIVEAIVDAGRVERGCSLNFAGVGGEGGRGERMTRKSERRGGLEEQSVPAEFCMFLTSAGSRGNYYYSQSHIPKQEAVAGPVNGMEDGMLFSFPLPSAIDVLALPLPRMLGWARQATRVAFTYMVQWLYCRRYGVGSP